MEFELTDRCNELRERLLAFMDEHVYPAEGVYHEQLTDSGQPHFHPPIMEELKARAHELGLWNLWLPHDSEGHSSPGLSNVEYAPLAEIMGRSHIAPEACNWSLDRGAASPERYTYRSGPFVTRRSSSRRSTPRPSGSRTRLAVPWPW